MRLVTSGMNGAQAEPWQDHHIEVDGHRIVMQTLGRTDGPNVAFLPGVLCSVSFWPKLLRYSRLIEHSRAASISLPAHSPAQAPDGFNTSQVTSELFSRAVSKSIEIAFDGQPAHLVGWSTGGFAALATAIDYPHLVSSVTSISGFGRGRWGSLPGLLQWIAMAGHTGKWIFRSDLRILMRFPRLFDWLYGRLAYRGRTIDRGAFEPILQDVRQGITNSNLRHLSFFFAGMRRVDILDRLDQIRCPVEIIAGERDGVISLRESRRLAGSIRTGNLTVMSDTGHLFFCENEAEVWGRIEKMILRLIADA